MKGPIGSINLQWGWKNPSEGELLSIRFPSLLKEQE
jgi:hypothetical protein